MNLLRDDRTLLQHEAVELNIDRIDHQALLTVRTEDADHAIRLDAALFARLCAECARLRASLLGDGDTSE